MPPNEGAGEVAPHMAHAPTLESGQRPGAATLDLIRRLVAFDTVSERSNLALIDFVAGYLDDLGVACELVHDEGHAKANLYATLGPADRSGIALSGHTDVVPVESQPWESDPFHVLERDGRLYGRGTSDMKSFIAVCLALAPEFLAREIAIPLHLVLSYDEEVGCLGVRGLIDVLREREVKPRAVFVGEPTGMQVVRAHKGKLSYRVHVRGLEAHSGMAHLGVNAVEAAAEAIAFLKGMARRHRDEGPFDEALVPPYTTVHTGLVSGGTQLNIVPRHCHFDFEFRHLPDGDARPMFETFERHVRERIEPEMHRVDRSTGFRCELLSAIPALDVDEDSEVVQLAKSLTGANATGKVSFGTEGGLFQESGMPAVICGPGSIAVAHRANEFIELDQVALCEIWLRRLVRHCWA